MKFNDLSDFCRLCLMPHNGSCIDCALDDCKELRDAIKMVYNIDINSVDEYSTKVCQMCCEVLIYNTIHYQRVVEAQKSLSFVQRIKNKLRNFGKKKTEPKEKKQPLSEQLDVEMDDASEQCCPKMSPNDENEMEVTSDNTDNIVSNPNVPSRPVCSPPKFFEHLTSFQQYHSQLNGPSLMGNSVDWNNNVLSSKMPADSKNNQKSPTSFFQMAKNFCENMMTKKPKPMGNIDFVLDEITNRMALLRFSSILDISAGY